MTPDEVKELMNKGLITQVIDPIDIVNNMETPPAGGCDCTEYVLPIAGTDVLGGVKIGSGMTISSDGRIDVLPDEVKLGSNSGLKIGSDKTLDVNLGSALWIDPDGCISVKYGNGLYIDDSTNQLCTSGGGGLGYTLPTASDTTLGGVKIGTHIDTNNSNAQGLSIDKDSGQLIIMCGMGIKINNNGALVADIDYIYRQILSKLQNDGYLQ